MGKNRDLIITICLSSIMGALASIMAVFVPSDIVVGAYPIHIAFDGLVLVIVSIAFGWKCGLLAGIISGLVEQLIKYGLTISTPVWMLSSIMWGLIPGLVLLLIKKVFFKDKSLYDNSKYLPCFLISILIGGLLASCSNVLAYYFDLVIMKFGYESMEIILAQWIVNIIVILIEIIPFTLITYYVVKALRNNRYLRIVD